MINHNLEKIWKTQPPRTPKTTYLEVFCIKLSSLYLISNGQLNGVNFNSLM